MKRYVLWIACVVFSTAAHASEISPEIIYRYVVTPNQPVQEFVSGILNLDGLSDSPGDGCEQRIGVVKVEGIQFSQSGATLESFRFTDGHGNQWSVPTNFDNLSNAGRSQANNFIRVGRPYYVDVQLCGNGGYPSLISIYDATIPFGM